MSGSTKAGPKARIEAPPLDLTGWPQGRAARRLRFIREYLLVPKGVGAGEPVALRTFQTALVKEVFAPGIRTALVSIPRANGKTMLAAMLAVAELWVGPRSRGPLRRPGHQ